MIHEAPDAHSEYYRRAKAYDVAFNFRDVNAEVDFLCGVFAQLNGRPARSSAELMCGPGRHALEMSRRGLRSYGVDLSPEMTAFAQERADQEKLDTRWLCQNVLHFALPEAVDLAYCLMDSFSYMLTNDDIVTHLQAVSKNLNPGGIYIIEMAHPVNFIGKKTKATAVADWESEEEGHSVHTTFGLDTDHFDPITEITQTTVLVRHTDQGRTEEYRDVSPLRSLSAQCFQALVALSGQFEISGWFGSLSTSIPFDNSQSAWRMVPVLKKR